jgi:single-strand DNA-binding protein
VNELIAQLLRASQHRFIGRLARDPEMRYFESGSYVCNCRMLINKPGAKKDDGQEPDGFKLELWNQQAQAFADAAHKGDLVDVSGRVKTEAWTDRTTGEERRALTVMVDDFKVIPRQGQGQPAPATKAAAPAPAPQQTWASGPASDGDDSEIPF